MGRNWEGRESVFLVQELYVTWGGPQRSNKFAFNFIPLILCPILTLAPPELLFLETINEPSLIII